MTHCHDLSPPQRFREFLGIPLSFPFFYEGNSRGKPRNRGFPQRLLAKLRKTKEI